MEEGAAQEGTGQESQHTSLGQGVAGVQVPGENKVCPEKASCPSLTPIVQRERRGPFPFYTGGAGMS